MSAIGIVNGTEIGEALVARLTSDGRRVLSGVDGGAFKKMCAEARLILVDVRRDELERVLHALGDHLDPNHLVAHTVHGLAGEASAHAIVVAESAVRRTGVLAGPLLVSALRQGRPTAAVIASQHPEVVEEFAETLSTPKLRVYRSRDPLGVELSASIAELAVVGCGVCDALELGAPARALMIVRAVRELGRVLKAIGADPMTATGLAGLGDILVRGVDDTAHSYRLGRALARAEEPDARSLAVLEQTARRLAAINKQHKVSAHLFDGLIAFLTNKLDPKALLEKLMTIKVLDE